MVASRQQAKPGAEDIQIDRDSVIEFLTFLLASAELCTREPYTYGSFRLLDGASRLAGLALRNVPDAEQHWLAQLKRDIDDYKGLLMWDRDGYFEYLQQVTGKIVEHLPSRAAS